MPGPIATLALIPTLQGGGAERVMLTLLRHLDRTRFATTLAVVDGRQRDLAPDLPSGIEVLDLGCARVRHAPWKILRLVRERRPRLLLSTLGHLNLMLAMMRPALPAGLKVVGREASIVSVNLLQMPHPALWRTAYRLFYRRLDLVVCQSRAMQSDLCGPIGFPAGKTVVIPNPVDVDRIRRLAEEPPAEERHAGAVHLVAAGRLSPEKGFDALIRAVSLCPELPLQLDILGQGPQGPALQGLVESLGLARQVRLRGFTPNPYPWLRRADAVVLSSHYEGLPNVVLEALACGTPVISSPVPAAQEILQDRPECVVAADHSPPGLAAALRAWCSRPAVRVPPDAMAGFAVDRVTRRYEEALEHVAGAI